MTDLLLHPNDVGFEAVASAPGDWHLLHTKSRQEKAIAESLSALKIPHYLPLMHLNRTYGGRKVPVELPMFPGYMFLKGSLDEVYTADRTKRIAHIIRVADQQKITWELRNLALAHERGAVFEPFPYLQVGLKVEIQSGSFQGIQGIIESKTKRDRVILQVGVLGQATSLEIDGAILSVIE